MKFDAALIGAVLVVMGLILIAGSKFNIGHLPGDIYIKRENFTFYFPLTTCIIISIIVGALFKFFKK